MSQCNNCQAKITCGCQVRVASNGRNVCSNCIQSYENSLKQPQIVSVSSIPSTPVVTPNDLPDIS